MIPITASFRENIVCSSLFTPRFSAINCNEAPSRSSSNLLTIVPRRVKGGLAFLTTYDINIGGPLVRRLRYCNAVSTVRNSSRQDAVLSHRVIFAPIGIASRSAANCSRQILIKWHFKLSVDIFRSPYRCSLHNHINLNFSAIKFGRLPSSSEQLKFIL